MLLLTASRASTRGWKAVLAVGASAAALTAVGVAQADDGALSVQAAAQGAADQTVQQVPPKSSDESNRKKGDSGEAVIVTGTRLRNSEFTSATPVQVLDPQAAQLRGQFDTAEFIQSSSIAAGSAQITSAISSAFVTNGGPGASTISLRGLGANRTLVLLNGERAGPAGTRGAVSAFDLNVLPQSIISNVQILKDGASSVYGSDAIAGVVNIITKKHTDGLEIDGTLVQPFKTGGAEYRGSLTWGKESARGHILMAGDFYQRQELARGQRKYLNCGEEGIYKPGTKTRADTIDPRTGVPQCSDLPWGQIWIYDLHYLAYYYGYTTNPFSNIPGHGATPAADFGKVTQFQYDYPGQTLGNLGNYIPALPAPRDAYDLTVPAGFYPVGYDPASYSVYNLSHPFVSDVTVIPKTTRYTAYMDGSYQLGDWIEAYGSFLFNRRETYQNGYRQFWTFGYTSDFFGFGNSLSPATGPYLESPTAVTDWSDSWQKVDYLRAVGGFRGEIDGGTFLPGWQWNVYGQFSRSSGAYSAQQIYNDSIMYQYDIGYGAGPCEGKVTPISQKNCVSINWWDPAFLAGEIPQNVRDYLFGVETGHTVYKQAYIEGGINGDVFDLPAGKVSVALGGVYRHDSIDDIPGDITYAVNPAYDPSSPVCQPSSPSYDPTNDICKSHVNNAWGNTAAGETKGSSTTKEFYGEIGIPLIKNGPLIQSFDVTASARYTNVSTAGEAATWKATANWAVNDTIRFRGTWGTSFRAPALFELYLADQTSFASQRAIDPCIQWGTNLANGTISQQVADNCAAQGVLPNHSGSGISATIFTGGGLGRLDSERSTARTGGVVLTPNFLFSDRTKVSIALDYFDIHVTGEVTQLGAANIIFGCLSSPTFPTDPLCSLYQRDPGTNYNITTVVDNYINIADQKNTGADLTAQLDQDLGKWGNLTLYTQMTWQFKDTRALFADNVQNLNGEDGEPYWDGNANLIWNYGPWKLFYGVQFIGRTSDRGDYWRANGNPDNVTDSVHTGPYAVDLVAEWRNYQSFSVTRSFGDDKYTVTLGLSNIWNTKPPRVSTINAGTIPTVGVVPYESQYDYVGRRAFLNVKAHF
ncbi:MAG: TonB-dependent receptor plug domain-containing protein [Alphaproteobacteria bacterium]|nr:TonB-dependent receptor plug domain-containing protein [Alphaproteobacteria bacterium]